MRPAKRRVVCSHIARRIPIDPAAIGRRRGRLAIVGIGPGDTAWRTPEASALVARSGDIVGYSLYLDLLGSATAGKTLHPGMLGGETERARLALSAKGPGEGEVTAASTPAYWRLEMPASKTPTSRPFAEVETPTGLKVRLFTDTGEALGLLSALFGAAGAR